MKVGDLVERVPSFHSNGGYGILIREQTPAHQCVVFFFRPQAWWGMQEVAKGLLKVISGVKQ